MKTIATLFLCCMIALAVAGCAKKPVAPGTPATPQTTYDKLSLSAYEIANAVDTGEKEFEALYSSNLPGVSDDAYAKTVTTIFLSAESCTTSYIAQLKSVAAVTAANQAQIVGWSNTLVSCVNTLINEGVVGIKNADARQKITSLLAPIPVAIKIICDALGIPTAQATRPCYGACAALKFTEVKLGHKDRSTTHRPGHSVSGSAAGIFSEAQAGKWPYRSTAPGRGRQHQRRGRDQDADVPCASQRRLLIKPLRESWVYA
jgi:hypothetical protein